LRLVSESEFLEEEENMTRELVKAFF